MALQNVALHAREHHNPFDSFLFARVVEKRGEILM